MSETIYELIEDLITAAQREGESWEWGENMNARKREAQKAKDKLRDEIAKYSASIAAKDAEIERLQTWLDEAQSACKGLGQTADNFGARLNAARAEVERLRGIIRGTEWVLSADEYDPSKETIVVQYECAICHFVYLNSPGEHAECCPFYQWEAAQ